MTNEKRFKPHLFDDGVNERYYDGIIDNEDDDKVITNYQYISNLLNTLHEEKKSMRQQLIISKILKEYYQEKYILLLTRIIE